MRARKAFYTHADDLLKLAEDVAIKGNPKCQTCILLNDYGSLGIISLYANKYGVWKSTTGQLASHHPGAKRDSSAPGTELLITEPKETVVKLEEITIDAMKDVQKDVEAFMALKEKYKVASSPDELQQIKVLGKNIVPT